METRADADTSVDTRDYQILLYLSKHESATIPEIEKTTGESWSETTVRLIALMNRGLVEGMRG